jgi:hypothetical protein
VLGLSLSRRQPVGWTRHRATGKPVERRIRWTTIYQPDPLPAWAGAPPGRDDRGTFTFVKAMVGMTGDRDYL